MSIPYEILDYTLLALGFGFVIFFHELGHFLAAKYVGVKVEQFAVGFGNAIVSWRQGLGFRVGSSQQEYQKRLREHAELTMGTEPGSADKPDPTPQQLERAARELHLGETEYRWNWIPLGGYVKMLGQDDLNPNATDADPRSFNMKSIRARMLVVSAGVIMNVILAAVGFMIVFLMGFNVPPAMVGSVMPGSPADNAVNAMGQRQPLQAGDTIVSLDGKPQYDFTKIALNVALSEEGAAVPIVIRHPDGTVETLSVTPGRSDGQAAGFLQLGITQPYALKGQPSDDGFDLLTQQVKDNLLPAEIISLKPGDVVTTVNGAPVKPEQYWIFDRALQASGGKPVTLTIQAKDGTVRTVLASPHFQQPFGKDDLNFAGMAPRAQIEGVMDKSPARGLLKPGDVVESLSYVSSADPWTNPSIHVLKERLEDAGDKAAAVKITVLRDGKSVEIPSLVPTMRVSDDHRGLGINLGYDENHAVIAEVLPETPAATAGLQRGMQLIGIDGKPVTTWFDVKNILNDVKPDAPLTVIAQTPGAAAPVTLTLKLSASDVADVQDLNYGAPMMPFTELDSPPRVTHNPLLAFKWGVIETRDFILQFYLTLQRMVQGSVSHTNMMGPIGIFAAGARFAYKGMDWLIWFLSMISANLAVVNFLPIPVVDGGLFTFLILEKLQGRPLSPKTQQVATLIGLALIISVFLLVSYQDIMRQIL
jgi:regulator of sigma E protease